MGGMKLRTWPREDGVGFGFGTWPRKDGVGFFNDGWDRIGDSYSWITNIQWLLLMFRVVSMVKKKY